MQQPMRRASDHFDRFAQTSARLEQLNQVHTRRLRLMMATSTALLAITLSLVAILAPNYG